eukprot:6014333-Lingulodinium_polyedra.AAC.1
MLPEVRVTGKAIAQLLRDVKESCRRKLTAKAAERKDGGGMARDPDTAAVKKQWDAYHKQKQPGKAAAL